jgi:hypothetical protein
MIRRRARRPSTRPLSFMPNAEMTVTTASLQEKSVGSFNTIEELEDPLA